MKPFLKWAGNKYALLGPIQAILSEFPADGRLIEPFVGSAAVFLNTHYPEAVLADSNADLIGLYQQLQADGPSFIDYCQTFFTPANNTAEAYYAWRDTFNQTQDRPLKAALFLYLNRHCFNGLCRYNSRNEFNVPFGRYQKPYFPRAEMIHFHQKIQGVPLLVQDFAKTMAQARPGDIVYCDPPYVPLSTTANFTSYSQGGFDLKQQQHLAQLASQLAQRDVIVLISNHNTQFTQEAYQTAQITELMVQRYISCKGQRRGKASELLALFSAPPAVPMTRTARR